MTTGRRGLKCRRKASVGSTRGGSPRVDEPALFQLPDASVGGRGLQPEFRSTDWSHIREAAYEERGG